MSNDAKAKLDDFFNWLMRVAGAIIIWLLTQAINKIDTMHDQVQDLLSEKKALNQRVQFLESEVKTARIEINDIFRNYDLKRR